MNTSIDMSWVEDRACRDLPPSEVAVVFFPEKASDRSWRQYCSGCPVRAECAMHGLLYEEFGVWGGLTQNDRRDIRAAIARGVMTIEEFVADVSNR